MKNIKVKLLSVALSATCLLSSVTPVAAYSSEASEVDTTAYSLELNDNSVTPNEVEDVVEKAKEVKEVVSETNAPVSEPLNNTIDKIIGSLTTIDPKSGAPRVKLASDALEAILIATWDLTNKTERVHRDIGFEVTRAVITMCDPFASDEKIKNQSESLKRIIEEAKNSPDLTDEDIATVYVKQNLAKTLSEARKLRFNKEITKKQKDLLNEAIRNTLRVKMKNRVTVAEINEATASLREFLDNFQVGKVEEPEITPVDEEVIEDVIKPAVLEPSEEIIKEDNSELIEIEPAEVIEFN